MRKIIRFAKSQSAQGLVEFALVLPVLLLIILGVFAFGHLFFAYSSVVSASREASRWGAAVGLSTGPYPRYKDCDAIRDAAVRVGSFAGVNRSRVTINYDSGPATASKGDCPAADGSHGPDNITLGDRINVIVDVPYTPIVPLLQLPTIQLTATSSRTILLSLPVGEVPTANSIYPTTTLNITVNNTPVVLANPGSTSIVGQVFTINVTVTSSDSTIPSGNLYIADDSIPQQSCAAMALVAGSASCSTFVYGAVTTDAGGVDHPHVIGIRYDPNGAHYNPSSVNVSHSVKQATSTTTITSVNPVSSSVPTQPITIRTLVAPEFSGVPTGDVVLRLADNSEVGRYTLTTGDNGIHTFTYLPTFTGDNDFIVEYVGDANFATSKSVPYPYHVESLDVNIGLTPTTGTVNSPVPFTVTVSSANGTGGTPSGTVFLNDAEGHSCSITLNGSGVGNCSLTFNTVKSYTLTAAYTSGNLTFKNKSASFTLNVIDKIATYIQLTPISSIIKPGSSMQFTVTVTQADGKTPNGTVGIASSLQPGTYVCTLTLNNTGTGTCLVPAASLPQNGPLSFQATFNPSNSTVYTASLSNVATVTVESNCPTASAMDYSTPGSIQFQVSNRSPNNVSLNVNQIVVNWNPEVDPLKDIVFVTAAQLNGGTCSSSGTNSICIWAYKRQNANDITGGISPSPQTFSASSVNKAGWDTTLANIGAGEVKIFRLDFVNSGLSASGNKVQITFDQGCSLTVGQ